MTIEEIESLKHEALLRIKGQGNAQQQAEELDRIATLKASKLLPQVIKNEIKREEKRNQTRIFLAV